MVARSKLAGSAADWLRNVDTAMTLDDCTYRVLKRQLLQQSSSTELSEKAIERIINRLKAPQETFVSYAMSTGQSQD